MIQVAASSASFRRQLLVVGILAVALGACRRGDSGSGLSDGVRFTGEAAVASGAGDSILLRIRATNRAREPRMVNIPHCEVSVAVLTGRGEYARIWNRSAWLQSTQEGYYQRVCLAYGLMNQIAPGESVETFRLTVSSRDILGDSLPAGRYRAIIGGDPKLKGGLQTEDFELHR